MDCENLQLSWDPELGGKRAWIVFEDDSTFDIGPDSVGRFEAICNRMLGGDYYPPDAIIVNGAFQTEHRQLRKGDRMSQKAPLFGRFGGPKFSSIVEIFVADMRTITASYAEELNRGKREQGRYCHFGYVTTQRHHGKGIWQARLEEIDGRLKLRVWSTSMPNSLWFWFGLPFARLLQLRARRRAVEEFRKI